MDNQQIVWSLANTQILGKLTFEDEAGTIYLTGDMVESSQAGYDKDGNPIVLLNFTNEGSTSFANATSKLVGQVMYIKLGGEIVSQPKVNDKITSTSAEITGITSYEEAESIASIINAGKLPLEFKVGEANKISATLGENALNASLIAGAIAMLVIFAIMIDRYRGLGIGASLALLIYVVLIIILLAITIVGLL